jgi:type IV pilus biogenesis protein CpaD/CtpE
MQLKLPLTIILSSLLLASCAEKDPPATNVVPQDASTDKPTDLKPKTPKPNVLVVNLDVQSPQQTSDLVASHKGKIVVVDLWALW